MEKIRFFLLATRFHGIKVVISVTRRSVYTTRQRVSNSDYSMNILQQSEIFNLVFKIYEIAWTH